jgi:hypothetical protein
MTAHIQVRLTPRASRNEIAGRRGGVLAVRVTAPPVDGAANAALERLLAAKLRVPKGAVRVVAREKSRDKRVAIDGLTEQEVWERLEGR